VCVVTRRYPLFTLHNSFPSPPVQLLLPIYILRRSVVELKTPGLEQSRHDEFWISSWRISIKICYSLAIGRRNAAFHVVAQEVLRQAGEFYGLPYVPTP
jgi:hypothetical protein